MGLPDTMDVDDLSCLKCRVQFTIESEVGNPAHPLHGEAAQVYLTPKSGTDLFIGTAKRQKVYRVAPGVCGCFDKCRHSGTHPAILRVQVTNDVCGIWQARL